MGAYLRKFNRNLRRLRLLKAESEAFHMWVEEYTYAEIGRAQGITAMGAWKRVQREWKRRANERVQFEYYKGMVEFFIANIEYIERINRSHLM